MAIAVTCPQCHTTLRVADNAAGRKVRCPKCAAVADVPTDQPSSTGGTGTAQVPTVANLTKLPAMSVAPRTSVRSTQSGKATSEATGLDLGPAQEPMRGFTIVVTDDDLKNNPPVARPANTAV